MRLTRVPGKKGGLYRRCTLWMGDDHLLAVESNGYTEQYKRLHYKDIQAVILRETTRKRDLSILLAALAFLTALPALIHLDTFDSPLSLMGIILSAGFLGLLLVNLFRGPTCACSIQMPLVTHDLPSLRRQKNAEAFLALLRPRVEGFQGGLSKEELRAGLYRLGLSKPQASPLLPSSKSSKPLPSEDVSSRMHVLAFGCLLLDASLTWFGMTQNALPLTILSTVTRMTLFVLLVTSAVRQWKSSIPTLVKSLLWSAMVVHVSYNITYWTTIYSIFIFSNQIQVLQDQFSFFSALAKLDPHDHPLLVEIMLAYALSGLIISASALLDLILDRWSRTSPGSRMTLHTSNGLQQGR